MSKLRYLPTTVIVIAVAALYYLHFFGQKKTAFVRSSDLIYSYEGMKDAQKQLDLKKNTYKSNIDTLKFDLQRTMDQYKSRYAQMSKEEKLEQEKLIYMQQENFKEYSAGTDEAIEKSDLELTQGVLNQVNTFVESYAKENGYKLIFGTTSSGNILYGEDYMDITEDVLKELNKNYKPLPEPLTSK